MIGDELAEPIETEPAGLAPEQIEYIVNHSEARYVIAENRDYLERLMKIQNEIQNVRKVIMWRGADVYLPTRYARGLRLPGDPEVLGVGAWYVPYVTPRVVLRLHRPAYEAMATVKLATSLAVFPAAYAAWLYLGWRGGDLTLLLLMAVLLPLAGLVSLYWREHWRELVPELVQYRMGARTP